MTNLNIYFISFIQFWYLLFARNLIVHHLLLFTFVCFVYILMNYFWSGKLYSAWLEIYLDLQNAYVDLFSFVWYFLGFISCNYCRMCLREFNTFVMQSPISGLVEKAGGQICTWPRLGLAHAARVDAAPLLRWPGHLWFQQGRSWLHHQSQHRTEVILGFHNHKLYDLYDEAFSNIRGFHRWCAALMRS